MIKYETINGTLCCRMVEPEPLTPEANFPCVVRLIQDDSPMGRNNDFYATSHLLAHIEIINGLDAIHFVRWQGSKTYYSRFEIIGYPVADGSLEWALYQIRSGKKVVKEGGGEQYGCSFYKNRLFYLNGSGCLVTKNAIGLIDPCSEEEFLSLDETGWQLYEEKPETAKEQFEVGDWVTDGVVDGYIAELDNGIAQVKKYGISYSTNVEHLRKLSPSEVVLDFGSGIRGTIRRYRGEQIRIYDGDINFACLAISYVTEPMQTTVRKLLAAIEEERKKQ